MNKRKLLALVMTLCMVAILAVGGTLAYFTDTDEATNVFTMGNVKITQYEHEFKDGEWSELKADTADTALKLMPVVYKGSTNEDQYPGQDNVNGTKFMTGTYYKNLDTSDGNTALEDRYTYIWDTSKVGNVVDKYVSVTNTGKNDVYVRTIAAVPANVDPYITLGTVVGSTWDEEEVAGVMIGDVEYNLVVWTYVRAEGKLEIGKSTGPAMTQVVMDARVDNETLTSKEFINGFKILVASQAVQTDGFAEVYGVNCAADALNAAFGKITATNHPWVAA